MYLTGLIFTDRSYKSTDAGNHTIYKACPSESGTDKFMQKVYLV